MFQIFFNKQKYHDVTFIVGEEIEFTANRTSLALISDVLEAMLFGKMKESQPQSGVKLPDIHPDAFSFQRSRNWLQNISLINIKLRV